MHRPAVLLVPLAAGLGAALHASRRAVEKAARSRHARGASSSEPPADPASPERSSAGRPVAKRIDPAGDALLADSPVATSRFRPLSLDPPETRSIVAKAGASLAVFLIAFHLASGRSRRRQLLVRVVAASTVAAMAIGLGHRILGEVQDLRPLSRRVAACSMARSSTAITSRSFSSLAPSSVSPAALAGASALNRVGWLAAALMAGACALGTLSRGAVLGLAAGTMVFVWLRQTAQIRRQETEPTDRPPRTMLWVTVMLILLAALAIGLGADQVVTRVRDTQVSQEMRLHALEGQPARPGGAPVRDRPRGFRARLSGIPNDRGDRRGSLLVHRERAAAVPGRDGLAGILDRGDRAGRCHARVVARAASRPDRGRAGRVAGGGAGSQRGRLRAGDARRSASVRRRFWGRCWDGPETSPSERSSPRLGVGVWAIALGGDPDRRGFGGVTPARPTSIDWWKGRRRKRRSARWRCALRRRIPWTTSTCWRRPPPSRSRRTPRGRSPRLHALNHALLLCPHCPDVHAAVAGTLWALGKRTQALRGMAHRGRGAPDGLRFHPAGRLGGGCAARGDRGHRGRELRAADQGRVIPGIPRTTGRGARAAAAGQRGRRPLRAGPAASRPGSTSHAGATEEALKSLGDCEEAFAAEPARLTCSSVRPICGQGGSMRRFRIWTLVSA